MHPQQGTGHLPGAGHAGGCSPPLWAGRRAPFGVPRYVNTWRPRPMGAEGAGPRVTWCEASFLWTRLPPCGRHLVLAACWCGAERTGRAGAGETAPPPPPSSPSAGPRRAGRQRECGLALPLPTPACCGPAAPLSAGASSPTRPGPAPRAVGVGADVCVPQESPSGPGSGVSPPP